MADRISLSRLGYCLFRTLGCCSSMGLRPRGLHDAYQCGRASNAANLAWARGSQLAKMTTRRRIQPHHVVPEALPEVVT